MYRSPFLIRFIIHHSQFIIFFIILHSSFIIRPTRSNSSKHFRIQIKN